MAQRIVTAEILRSNGDPWAGAVVDFSIAASAWTTTPDATFPADRIRAVADASGTLSVTLAGGLDATWTVRMPDGETFTIEVPNGAATTLEDLRAAFG